MRRRFPQHVRRLAVAAASSSPLAFCAVRRNSTEGGGDQRSLIERLGRMEEQLKLAVDAQKVANAASQNKKSGGGSGADTEVPPHILRSVVKIYSNLSAPNYLIPWQRKLQTSCTGSGFVVDVKRRLLATNAHVVASATYVEVRKHGDAHRYYGQVVYLGLECDLALICVLDPTFWSGADAPDELSFAGAPSSSSTSSSNEGTATTTTEGSEGLQGITTIGAFDGFPQLQHSVKVVGYPMGGDQISITSGVVSRVDTSTYSGADISLATIQLDAAINPGNSGGPAIADSKVVGIAFQTLVQADNIGYIIPNAVVSMFTRGFLADAVSNAASSAVTRLIESVAKQQQQLQEGSTAADGADTPSAEAVVSAAAMETVEQLPRSWHRGFAALGIYYQETSNPALRKKYNVPVSTVGGIFVEYIMKNSLALGKLEVGDIILSVNGLPIAADGTVEWRPRERLRFSHILQMTANGETVKLRVWREKKEMELELASSIRQSLIPTHLYNDRYKEVPPYQIFGGCVFTIASMPYLLEWGPSEWYNNSPRWLTGLTQSGEYTEERKEVVVLSQIMPHAVNKGYTTDVYGHRGVKSINGTEVRDLSHFVSLIQSLKAEAAQRKEQGNTEPLFAELKLTVGTPSHCTMVLPVQASADADAELKELYRIPALSAGIISESKPEEGQDAPL